LVADHFLFCHIPAVIDADTKRHAATRNVVERTGLSLGNLLVMNHAKLKALPQANVAASFSRTRKNAQQETSETK